MLVIPVKAKTFALTPRGSARRLLAEHRCGLRFAHAKQTIVLLIPPSLCSVWPGRIELPLQDPQPRVLPLYDGPRLYILPKVLMQEVQILILRQPADVILSGTLAHWRLGY